MTGLSVKHSLCGSELLPDQRLEVEAWELLALDMAASRVDREETTGRLRRLLRVRT